MTESQANDVGFLGAALDVAHLHAYWGGRRVLEDISLALAPGKITALIGANGAGKTSLMLALCGAGPRTEGSIALGGRALAALPAHERVAHGLMHCPEGRRVFARMSVEENLLLGAYLRCDKAAVRDDLERSYARFARLGERRHQAAGTLSGGEQQLLALTRAAMGRPRVLLLDEPSLGLAPRMVEEVFAAIGEMASEGLTILLVEQNATLALGVAHEAAVLELGRIVLRGSAASLREDERIQNAYLGRSPQATS